MSRVTNPGIAVELTQSGILLFVEGYGAIPMDPKALTRAMRDAEQRPVVDRRQMTMEIY